MLPVCHTCVWVVGGQCGEVTEQRGTHTNMMFLGSGGMLFCALSAQFLLKQVDLLYAKPFPACKKACCCEAELSTSMVQTIYLTPLFSGYYS